MQSACMVGRGLDWTLVLLQLSADVCTCINWRLKKLNLTLTSPGEYGVPSRRPRARVLSRDMTGWAKNRTGGGGIFFEDYFVFE